MGSVLALLHFIRTRSDEGSCNHVVVGNKSVKKGRAANCELLTATRHATPDTRHPSPLPTAHRQLLTANLQPPTAKVVPRLSRGRGVPRRESGPTTSPLNGIDLPRQDRQQARPHPQNRRITEWQINYTEDIYQQQPNPYKGCKWIAPDFMRDQWHQ